ncbi:MAG: PD40 domain-containing protein [Saprospiraceae bacterium]|nr:PD40 domain-containing protein [Saprospiraceae bacterium]
MKIRISLFTVILSISSVSAQQSLRLNPPPSTAEIFGKNFISTGISERDFALSPDGTELFYTIQSPLGIFQTIAYSKKDKSGNWSKPEIAPFAGKFSDLEPAFTADGNKLFFSSNRPLSGSEIKDFDIWVVEKKNGIWGEPINLGSPVNTKEDEFYPSIAHSGNLYYTAAYQNGIGKEDIFVSKWENGTYTAPVPLDTAVNSKSYEFNAFVSPEEDFIIFTAYGRKDDNGRGDLYMSVKDAAGHWQPAKNLSMLNTAKLDYCPFVSFDKKILFFTSERINIKNAFPENAVKINELRESFVSPQNGGGDIYWISFDKIREQF